MGRSVVAAAVLGSLLVGCSTSPTATAATGVGSPPVPPPLPVPSVPPAAASVPSVLAPPAAGPAPAELGAPPGYVTMRALRVAATAQGAAVLLVDAAQSRVVPIFIGDGEALSIHLRLSGRRAQRPLTHDLMDSTLRELGTRLVHVQVDRIEGGVFFGTVVLQQSGVPSARTLAIDARPSDAIALAVGNAVPIYVAPAVIAEAGLGAEALDAPPAPEPHQTL